MLCGIGLKDPAGENQIIMPRLDLAAPKLVAIGDQLGGRHQRVRAQAPWHPGRVGIASLASRKRIADVTANRRHCGERLVDAFEMGPLLDVKLQVSFHPIQGDRRPTELGDICAKGLKVLNQRFSGIEALEALRLFATDRPHQKLAAEIGRTEPRALFSPETQHAQAARTGATAMLQRGQSSDSGDHSREPVVVPTSRNRVNVRPDENFGRVVELSLAGDIDIPDAVIARIETARARILDQYIAGRGLYRTIRITRYPDTVMAAHRDRLE